MNHARPTMTRRMNKIGKEKEGVQEPKSLQEYIQGKPSRVLRLIVEGLRSTTQHADQKVYMGSFGETRNAMCYGCAATWAFQAFKGGKLTPAEAVDTRKRPIKDTFTFVSLFEASVDGIRCGGDPSSELEQLTGVRLPLPDLPMLTTSAWFMSLPAYEKLAAKLEVQGL